MLPDHATHHIHAIVASEIAPATESLALSFAEDPLVIHLFPDPVSRPKLSRQSFSLFFRWASRRGICHSWSTSMESVALWLSPGGDCLGLRDMLAYGAVRLALSSGFAATKRLLGFTDFASEIHHDVVSQPHWYLLALGTLPEHRGKGLAGKLMAPVLEKAHRENTPCFLETNNECNLRFYESLGFDVVKSTVIPGTTIGHWAMLR